MINEDNASTASLWKAARTRAQLIYISPEMALSDSFTKLWKDASFRKRLQAIVVDEAHCIDEWGEEFRPLYRELSRLRHYTGQDVPFVACTATCTSTTFDIIWHSLGFGHRPFWGIDVGCGRPNLLFLTRVLKNIQNPVLDILNIFPQLLDANTPREVIGKSLLYFDSEEACRLAVRTLRKVLPTHLRDCVQPFSSDASEAAKASCWEGFMSGHLRILCATDAAGMGCNVPDVLYSVVFGCPKSLSVIAQRWGRAARDRTLLGTCLLLVPDWAFRPAPPELGLAVQRVKGRPKIKVESKRRTSQRANLNSNVEAFINSGSENPRGNTALNSAFPPLLIS
jgi:superfamily II DNA helicase RecQ